MRYFVCAVYDKATAQYGNAFNVVSKGQAVRTFTDEVNNTDANNQLSMHPGDFELYYLGQYDTESGLFTQDGNPERICQGVDVKVKPGF